MKAYQKILYAVLLLLVFTFGISAGTIGPSCSSCFGGIYTLSGALQSTNGKRETWRITYDLDVSGYNGPSKATYISAIAAKVVSGAKLLRVTTVSTPTSGIWKKKPGGLSNSGCDGSGSGWVCLQWKSGDKLLLGPGTPIYSWVFDVTMKAGSLKSNDALIKADFNPRKGRILSEKIGVGVKVPEGVTGELPLLLSGLTLSLIWWKRRRLSNGISVSH